MDILQYIEELMNQGYTEENACIVADYAFSENYQTEEDNSHEM